MNESQWDRERGPRARPVGNSVAAEGANHESLVTRAVFTRRIGGGGVADQLLFMARMRKIPAGSSIGQAGGRVPGHRRKMKRLWRCSRLVALFAFEILARPGGTTRGAQVRTPRCDALDGGSSIQLDQQVRSIARCGLTRPRSIGKVSQGNEVRLPQEEYRFAPACRRKSKKLWSEGGGTGEGGQPAPRVAYLDAAHQLRACGVAIISCAPAD